MMTARRKTCECGTLFVVRSNRQRWCDMCAQVRHRQLRHSYDYTYRLRRGQPASRICPCGEQYIPLNNAAHCPDCRERMAMGLELAEIADNEIADTLRRALDRIRAEEQLLAEGREHRHQVALFPEGADNGKTGQ